MKTFANEGLRVWFWAVIVMAVVAGSSPSRADDDTAHNLGVYLAQHGYGRMNVDRTENNREIVEARIDGKEVSMLVDSGFPFSSLNARCAAHLQLALRDTGETDWGTGGAVAGTTCRATIKSLTLNGYEINRLNTLNVLPKSVNIDSNFDGFFGFDLLRLNAVIMPVGAKYFLFKPGSTPVASIDSYMKALQFKAVPLHYARGHLFAVGQMNGKPFHAIIDSGAQFSDFDFDYIATTLGLKLSYEGLTNHGVDGRVLPTFTFPPTTLQIGPVVAQADEMTASKSPTFKRAGFDAWLGYDFLARHKAIIDIGTSTLWMQ